MKGVFARMLMELAGQSAETDTLTDAVYAAAPGTRRLSRPQGRRTGGETKHNLAGFLPGNTRTLCIFGAFVFTSRHRRMIK